MRERLEAAGHVVVGYMIVRDEPDEINAVLDRETSNPDCQAILFNGGTGIARRDTTFDVISRRLDKTLPGFGELFRMLSYEEIGAAAMLSRATAGVLNGRLVVSTPGSSNAVALAMDRLIAGELAHLVFEVSK
jgi:molybdenum cofactor biosynthesis protein B